RPGRKAEGFSGEGLGHIGRNLASQNVAAIIRHRDDIFNSNAKLTRNIDPGLDRDTHPGFEPERITAYEKGRLVNVQADAMAQAMEETVAQAGGLDDAASGGIHRFTRYPGPNDRQRRGLCLAD